MASTEQKKDAAKIENLLIPNLYVTKDFENNRITHKIVNTTFKRNN
jgi:hypothetical protein